MRCLVSNDGCADRCRERLSSAVLGGLVGSRLVEGGRHPWRFPFEGGRRSVPVEGAARPGGWLRWSRVPALGAALKAARCPVGVGALMLCRVG